MPTVDFGRPPELGADATYSRYRSWLDRALYMRLCGYCLLRNPHLQIDHFEPQKYAPSKVHDPNNLTLACQACNGRGGKSDYHPLHTGRRRLPEDTSGHSVVDVRVDDFAELFHIGQDGKISAKPGPSKARAEWNIVLLNLQRDIYDTMRCENLDTLSVAEKTLKELARGTPVDQSVLLQELLEKQVMYLGRWLPFFDALGIPLSPELRARVEAARESELP